MPQDKKPIGEKVKGIFQKLSGHSRSSSKNNTEMSKPLTLVTGGTGFVGSWVVLELLKQGYSVRATARSGKTKILKDTYPEYASQLDVVEVNDLAKGDFTEAFKGVGALIHVAAPGFTKGETSAEILDGVVHGTTNIVNQAIKAGVKKVVATGTFGNLFDVDFKQAFGTETLTPESWGQLDRSSVDVEKQPPMFVYQAGKLFAEQDIWEIAKSHPEVDIAAIIPPAVYGKFVPHFPRPKDRGAIGTDNFIYSLITGGSGGPNTYPDIPIANAINVEDAAKAHVAALSAAPLKDGRKKRLIVTSGIFTWPQAAALLRKERPELANRLPKEDLPAPPQTSAPLSTDLSAEVLGIKSYIPWEKTVVDVIDEMLKWESEEAKA